MPSIVVPRVTTAFSATTATGKVTVTSSIGLLAGANVSMRLGDGTAFARAKIIKVIDATHIQVREWPVYSEHDGSASYDKENSGPPQYGGRLKAAMNAAGVLTMEIQTVPVDPAYTGRTLP
jgi:hypothetical protein